MKVRVKLFAIARETAGAEFVDVTILATPGGVTTAAELRAAFLLQLPNLQFAAKQLLFAVDGDYATEATVVTSASDVACIPPVSGG